MRVLGGSNEKYIFSQSSSFRQQFMLQNDILELHVALAKKMLHMFEKSISFVEHSQTKMLQAIIFLA